MKVGILSGGGDAPGINAVIRAVVRKGIWNYGYEFVGIRDGWRGLIEGEFIPCMHAHAQIRLNSICFYIPTFFCKLGILVGQSHS